MRKFFAKTVKTLAALALSAVIAVSGFGSVVADAATRKNAEPINYSLIVRDDSTTVTGTESTIKVNTYYQRIKLSGSDAATKKINKTLLKASKAYDPETILSIAEEAADGTDMFEGSEFYDFFNSFITDRTEDYISIVVTREWWAGGVSNNFEYGYVFDLNTGKKIYITKASGKSLKYIKQRLIGNILADGEFEGFEAEVEEAVNSLTTSKINYYINSDGLCVVVFNAYELGFGGWVREYIIE